MQEFIARGAVQGSLSRLITSKHSGLISIIVSSLLFGALHMCHSEALSIASLIMGLVWGWMYNRQKSLLGVSISHFLIGTVSGLMGYWIFFN